MKRGIIVAGTLLGLVVTPAAVDAQQGSGIPRLGIISTQVPVSTWRQSRFARDFLKGLRDVGYEEGEALGLTVPDSLLSRADEVIE